MKSYGVLNKSNSESEIDQHLESISIKGYSIKESLFSRKYCDEINGLIEKIYFEQCQEFGIENMEIINELDIARMPFIWDTVLLDILMNDRILEIVDGYIGENYHLHLQNAIINRVKKIHHQTAWHRDLPYQDWIISKPLGINAFVCLTDFTAENGATEILPFSHKIDFLPNGKYLNENVVKIIAPAGSVVFFDSMLYHRASSNNSDNVRIGLNNMYVSPIIRQQINIPEAFGDPIKLSEREKTVLGYKYITPNSVLEFRKMRLERSKNEK